MSARWTWTDETAAAFEHLATTSPRAVAARDALISIQNAEPVLVMLDAAIKWAKAYRARFERPVSEDSMAAQEIGAILAGARALHNFDGAKKMERDARNLDAPSDWTDSKENGMLESLYWTACEIAGIDGNDL